MAGRITNRSPIPLWDSKKMNNEHYQEPGRNNWRIKKHVNVSHRSWFRWPSIIDVWLLLEKWLRLENLIPNHIYIIHNVLIICNRSDGNGVTIVFHFSIQYGKEDTADVWNLYGTVSCKAELAGTMPDITLNISHSLEGSTMPLDHLIIHPCVQSADAAIIETGNDNTID